MSHPVFSSRPLLIVTLILFTLPPIGGGILRFVDFATAREITVLNARFFASPTPVVLHILAIAIFGPIGLLQVWQALGRRNWKRHRQLGPMLLTSGWVAALTGLWMTLFYPPAPIDDGLLFWVRIVAGGAMVATLAIGTLAIRRRDFACHGRMMLRAYAIGMGAGTQAMIGIPWTIMLGAPEGLSRTLMLSAGWLINIVLVEWFLARSPRPGRRPLAA